MTNVRFSTPVYKRHFLIVFRRFDATNFGTLDKADEYVKANYRRLSGG
jgi:hypothetical protein